MNQQQSSNEINGSGVSNNEVPRQEQSGMQIPKLNHGNFV